MHEYVAELLEEAKRTELGKTWLLDRKLLMLAVKVSDIQADSAVQEIERTLPWRWQRQMSLDRRLLMYRRVAQVM